MKNILALLLLLSAGICNAQSSPAHGGEMPPSDCDTAIRIHNEFACKILSPSNTLLLAPPASTPSYLWSTGSGNATINADAPGDYWRINTANVCDYYVDTFHVEEFIQVMVGNHNAFTCEIDTPYKTGLASPVSAAVSYEWNTGATTGSISAPIGKYWCRAIKDCILYVDTFNVYQFQDSITRNHDTLACLLNRNVTLNSISNAAQYRWSTGATTQSVSVGNGTYIVKASKDCRLNTDVFVVGNFQDTTEHQKDTVICDPASGILLQGASSGDSWLWNTGDTVKDITAIAHGKYICHAANGCSLSVDTIDLVQPQPVGPVNLGNDTTVCHSISIGGTYPAATSYLWNTGATTPAITPPVSGKYVLTISDGCTMASDDINLIIDDCNECLMVPNAFTPNGDGINDRFTISSNCMLEAFNIKIYDRWSNLVFSSSSVNVSWDGNYNGAPAPMDVYSVIITYFDGSAQQRNYVGNVTLIR